MQQRILSAAVWRRHTFGALALLTMTVGPAAGCISWQGSDAAGPIWYPGLQGGKLLGVCR